MTKAEHYYNRHYKQHLRTCSDPKMNSIEVKGRRVTAEEAATYAAARALLYFKATERKIKECCTGMYNHFKERENKLEAGDTMGLIPNYKQPAEEPFISLAGNIITFCPFCGTKLEILPYVDEEYTPEKQEL